MTRAPCVPFPVLPLADEPFVADWDRYLLEGGERPFAFLQERLPQLAIPVRAGVSKTTAYRNVTRRGEAFSTAAFGGRLELEEPWSVHLAIEGHTAGALPVLSTPNRRDFETLLIALACRHEPRDVNPAVNAQLVSGLVNWDRLGRYRATWLAAQGSLAGAGGWPAELARVEAGEPWRFLDRVLLACDRPYSGVGAAELGLPMGEAEWLDRSRILRVEHELTHYARRRLLGGMSEDLFEELLADFMGLTRALGRFEAGWFLRFLGLEDLPRVRDDGRLHAYTAGLSRDAVARLCEVAARAAAGLEALAGRWYGEAGRIRFFLALASLGLGDVAGDGRDRLFEEAWERAGRLVRAPS